MCHQIKTIAKNCNGELTYCENCKVYHLTFNNLYIELTSQNMTSFQKFVNSIEVDYWEMKYEGMPMKRKIPIQTLQQNLSMMFNRQELQSLKDLIFQNTKMADKNLSLLDIDYMLFLN
ncbi:MAG: hypothetical protein ACI83B_000665 [Sediminicola sp.]|jgi:hypothetical protein